MRFAKAKKQNHVNAPEAAKTAQLTLPMALHLIISSLSLSLGNAPILVTALVGHLHQEFLEIPVMGTGFSQTQNTMFMRKIMNNAGNAPRQLICK